MKGPNKTIYKGRKIERRKMSLVSFCVRYFCQIRVFFCMDRIDRNKQFCSQAEQGGEWDSGGAKRSRQENRGKKTGRRHHFLATIFLPNLHLMPPAICKTWVIFLPYQVFCFAVAQDTMNCSAGTINLYPPSHRRRFLISSPVILGQDL